MKKISSFLIGLIIGFTLIQNEAIGQNFLPSPMKISIPQKNYSEAVKSLSDTLWLYHNMRVYHWENNEYLPLDTYTYFEYSNQNAPSKANKIYTIKTGTDDSLMYYINEFDTLQRISKQVFLNYDSTNDSWVFTDQAFYWYDDFDNDTSILWQTWNEELNSWINNVRIIRAYNDQNYLLLDISQQWNSLGNYWVTTIGYKYEYSNNALGCPDTLIWSEWDTYEKGWGNYLREYWIYDVDNVPVEYTFELWDATAGKYQNYQRFFNLDYSNWPGCSLLDHNFKPVFYTFNQQNWSNGWIDILEFNATYDDEGGYESIIRKPIDNEWVNSEKRQIRFNSKGYNILKKKEIWDMSHWIVESADTTLLLFENDKLIESKLEVADTSTNNNWIPFTKYRYFDYFWYLGINDYNQNSNKKMEMVSIVPNPSEGNISIKLIDEKEAIATVSVINISGKIIFQNQYLNSASHVVLINNPQFERGVYIVRITTKSNIDYFSKLIFK